MKKNFWTETALLNFRTTLPLVKLNMIGERVGWFSFSR